MQYNITTSLIVSLLTRGSAASTLSATSLSYFLPHPNELVRIVATLEAMVEPGDLVPLAEKRLGHPRIGEGNVVELKKAGHHTFSSISKIGSGAVGEPPNTRAASRQPPRHFAALSQPSHILGR